MPAFHVLRQLTYTQGISLAVCTPGDKVEMVSSGGSIMFNINGVACAKPDLPAETTMANLYLSNESCISVKDLLVLRDKAGYI